MLAIHSNPVVELPLWKTVFDVSNQGRINRSAPHVIETDMPVVWSFRSGVGPGASVKRSVVPAVPLSGSLGPKPGAPWPTPLPPEPRPGPVSARNLTPPPSSPKADLDRRLQAVARQSTIPPSIGGSPAPAIVAGTAATRDRSQNRRPAACPHGRMRPLAEGPSCSSSSSSPWSWL